MDSVLNLAAEVHRFGAQVVMLTATAYDTTIQHIISTLGQPYVHVARQSVDSQLALQANITTTIVRANWTLNGIIQSAVTRPRDGSIAFIFVESKKHVADIATGVQQGRSDAGGTDGAEDKSVATFTGDTPTEERETLVARAADTNDPLDTIVGTSAAAYGLSFPCVNLVVIT